MVKNRPLLLSVVGVFCAAMIVGNAFGRSAMRGVTDTDGFGSLGRQFATYGNLGGSIRRAPLYPVFLGLTYGLLGDRPFSVVFSQSILLGILGACAVLLSYRTFGSLALASLTGLCVILHPVCLWYVPRLWLELLFADFVLVVTWCAYRALTHPTSWNLVRFGISAGIASLCKAVLLLFPLFLAVSVLALRILHTRPLSHLGKRTLLSVAIIPTGAMLVAVLPWTIRNHAVSDTWTLVSSNAGIEFFRGNVFADQNSFLLQKTIPEMWIIAQEEETRVLSERGIDAQDRKAKNETFDSMMVQFILNHPLRFCGKILKQIPAFWMRGETTGKSLVFLVFAVTTLSMFTASFVLLRQKSVLPYVVLIMVVYFNLTYAATLAWARYSMPVYPPMLIVCAYGIAHCHARRGVPAQVEIETDQARHSSAGRC